MTDPIEITRLLTASAAGDRTAFDQLVPLIYGDLRAVAQGQLARLRPGETWSATALVNEAWMRLVEYRAAYADRGHFFAVSARMMCGRS